MGAKPPGSLVDSRAGRFRRLIYYLLQGIVTTVVGIFLLPPAIVIFIFTWAIVWLLAKLFRPDLEAFVTGVNTIFTLGKRFNYPINTIGIATINGIFDSDTNRRLVQERVFTLTKPNGDLVYDGLKKSWEKFLGYPFWKKDDKFDLRNHVRDFDYPDIKVPAAPSESDVHKIIGKIITEPWKKDQSPWEILLIHNFKGESKTVLVIRIDHVLADGFSIYEFFKILTQSAWRVPEFKISNRKFSLRERLALLVTAPANLLAQGWAGLDPSAYRLPFHHVANTVETIFSVSPEISVDTIKQIKRHFNVSYTTVCYAAICGAVVRSLQNAGVKIPRRFMSSIILPLPKHPGGLCIHASIATVVLPLRSSSPEKRLQKINKALGQVHGSRSSGFLPKLAKGLTIFPIPIMETAAWLTKGLHKVNVGTANIPVTTGLDYYEGLEITELTTANSLVFDVGMMISLGGVNNKQRVSFCVRRNMFESEEICQSLGIYFAEEIQLLVNMMT